MSSLDEELVPEYEKALIPDKASPEWAIVKCADRVAAYIKCIDEVNMGNKEFKKAHQSIGKDVKAIDIEEVKYFLDKMLPAFTKTLDELD